MAAVLQRVKEGKLSLSDRTTLRLDQQRIPSGVLYALDPGLRPTVKDLLVLMTIISDNVATDALADLVGRDEVTSLMASLGFPGTRLRFSDLEWDRLWLSALDPTYADGERRQDHRRSPSKSTATRRSGRRSGASSRTPASSSGRARPGRWGGSS